MLIAAIGLYRMTLSGWLGGQCRFSPTCSAYAQTAIATHGALRGTALAAWRIARCNPFGSGGFESVPPGRHGTLAGADGDEADGHGYDGPEYDDSEYDDIIRESV